MPGGQAPCPSYRSTSSGRARWQGCWTSRTLFLPDWPAGSATRGVGLSGGQRQRVGIARGLLRDSPIVLLDEPTSGLDLRAERRLIDALKELMIGRTVIMTTHRSALLDLADTTVHLREGRLLSQERLLARNWPATSS